MPQNLPEVLCSELPHPVKRFLSSIIYYPAGRAIGRQKGAFDMTENEYLKALIKAFNAGREFSKFVEVPEALQNGIEDAYPFEIEIVAHLDSLPVQVETPFGARGNPPITWNYT
jgi:hypothetical protein